MEAKQFSRTALISACIRAFHSAHDDPKIFDDFLAHRLVSMQECQSLGLYMPVSLKQAEPPVQGPCPDRATALTWWIKVIAGSIIARARYVEDALEQSIRQGIKQYVILGAGMDTFAFRRPELLEQIRVFEIDHPATQALKRRRIEEGGLKLPDALHFIPHDFVEESLTAALKRTPYDPKAPTFLSWPGVTYYLSRRDVMNTFRAIADIAPAGAGIVFDYLDERFFDPENPHQSVHLVLRNVQLTGEPMMTGFDPGKLASDLACLGFRIREDLSPDNVERLFLMGRTDCYHAGLYIHFARAEVV